MENINMDAYEHYDKVLAETHKIVDEMTYHAYFHNRRISPHVPLSEWTKIFCNVDQLEERYQEELYFNRKEIEFKQ